MKLKQKVRLAFLASGLLLIVAGIAGTTYFVNKEKKDQIFQQLRTVVVDRATWINNYIVERQTDIHVLSHSLEVESVFVDEKMEKASEVREEIQGDAKRVAGEIEKYLADNPTKTLEELQDSSEFQAIAVQRVGQTGYTAVTDYDTLTARFHSSPGVVDLDLHNLAEKLPGFWLVMERTEGGETSGGFYDWIESDGSIKTKYMFIEIVERRTADGVGLSVAATAYVEEYGLSMEIARDSVEYFTSVKKLYGYKDLLMVSVEGDVLWSVERAEELGTNLMSGLFSETNLASVYREALSSDEVVMSDYEIYLDGEPAAFLAMGVWDDDSHGRDFSHDHDENDTLLGVVILEIDAHVISEIVGNREGLGESGETYLVGMDGLMRSNSRFLSESSLLKQDVKSDNFDICQMHAEKGLFEDAMSYSRGAVDYLGYRDVEVYGTHSYVDALDWCLIGEIEKEEILLPVRELSMMIVGVGVLSLMVFMVMANLLGGKLVGSIVELIKGVRVVEQGDLHHRVKVGSQDEIGELAQSFNQMAEQLEKSRDELESKVEKRTGKLEKTMDLMVGRELKMKDLKKTISDQKAVISKQGEKEK